MNGNEIVPTKLSNVNCIFHLLKSISVIKYAHNVEYILQRGDIVEMLTN